MAVSHESLAWQEPPPPLAAGRGALSRSARPHPVQVSLGKEEHAVPGAHRTQHRLTSAPLLEAANSSKLALSVASTLSHVFVLLVPRIVRRKVDLCSVVVCTLPAGARVHIVRSHRMSNSAHRVRVVLVGQKTVLGWLTYKTEMGVLTLATDRGDDEPRSPLVADPFNSRRVLVLASTRSKELLNHSADMQPRSSARKSESFSSASSCSVRSLSPRATHPFLNSCSPRHSHGVRARGSTSPQQSPGSDSVFLTALKYPDITDRDRTTHRHSTRSLRATRLPATHAATRGTARRLTLAPAGAPTTAHAQSSVGSAGTGKSGQPRCRQRCQ